MHFRNCENKYLVKYAFWQMTFLRFYQIARSNIYIYFKCILSNLVFVLLSSQFGMCHFAYLVKQVFFLRVKM